MEPKKKKAKPKGGKDSNSQTKPIKATDSAKSNCSRCSLKPVKSATPKSHMDLQFVLPTTYQPSKTAQFEQLFLSYFVSEFDHQKLQGLPTGSWYDHLPSIYSSTPYESCKESIRSTTMLHYGVMTKNQSIQTEAYRWYSKALESQRMFLRIDPLPPGQTMPAAEEALTAVILGMFELVSSTTPTGWINHFMGAASILQMRKPENCQTGLAHLVFRAMRPATVGWLDYDYADLKLTLDRFVQLYPRNSRTLLRHIHGILFPLRCIPKQHMTGSWTSYSFYPVV